MGCGASRLDDVSSKSKPVVLLKDRVDLIRAAADARFALASSHAAYSRSLRAVGEALERFVREELAVVDVSPPGSPVLTIPSSDGKGKGKRQGGGGGKSTKSFVDDSGSTISVGGGSHMPAFSDDSHIHFDDDDSHLPLSSSSDDEDDRGHIEQTRQRGQIGVQEPMQHAWPPQMQASYPYPAEAAPVFSQYYMRRTPGIPTTVYQQPPNDGYGYSSYRAPSNYGPSTSTSSSNTAAPGIYSPFFGYYDRPAMDPPPPARPPTPPPPPPPEVSGWDFLDPFSAYDQGYGGYSFRSVPSSPSSTEVREKEGIPDLEEETEAENPSSRDVKNVRGKGIQVGIGESSGTKGAVPEAGSSGKKGSRSSKAGDSKAASPPRPSSKTGSAGSKGRKSKATSPPLKKDIAGEKPGSDTPCSECIAFTDSTESEEGSKKTSSLADDDSYKKKGVTFDVDMSLQSEKSGFTLSYALSAPGTRDVTEVVEDIRQQFMEAAVCWEALWELLEVGRMPYRSRRRTVFRAVSSRIFTSLPKLTRSRRLYKHPRLSPSVTLKMVRLSQRNVEYLNGKSNDLSFTLETLYAWENKLYREVKSEEKLRLAYDKKFKHLKKLTDKGEDYHKVYFVQASVKSLSTKIEVAIRSIQTISKSIQKLRDGKLQKQLVALIQGLMKMCNSVIDCHRKQLEAIADCKTHNLIAKSGIGRNSVAAATKDLEREVNKWLVSFDDWISCQKSCVESLHGWLMGWLNVEPEITADGIVPFSPGRIGAPAVFIMCNDWYSAMNRIPDKTVNASIHGFAERIHRLWEIQTAEQQHRLKADYLSKDHQKRHGALTEAGVMRIRGPDTNSSEVAKNNAETVDERVVALESLKNRLDEEIAKHEEARKKLQESSSSSLKAGLAPVFKALGDFSWEILKAYNRIRLPDANQRS